MCASPPPRVAPSGAVVLASLCSGSRVEPRVFGLWMAVLRSCARCVLWLLRQGGAAQARVLREAAARGVHPGRVLFVPKLTRGDNVKRCLGNTLFVCFIASQLHATAVIRYTHIHTQTHKKNHIHMYADYTILPSIFVCVFVCVFY